MKGFEAQKLPTTIGRLR